MQSLFWFPLVLVVVQLQLVPLAIRLTPKRNNTAVSAADNTGLEKPADAQQFHAYGMAGQSAGLCGN